MDSKEQGKGILAMICMVMALAIFFFVSNEHFKEELKIQAGSYKYDAKAQVTASCERYLERG